MTRLLALAAATAAAFASMPAAAQEQAGDRVNTVIVYGDDTAQALERFSFRYDPVDLPGRRELRSLSTRHRSLPSLPLPAHDGDPGPRLQGVDRGPAERAGCSALFQPDLAQALL